MTNLKDIQSAEHAREVWHRYDKTYFWKPSAHSAGRRADEKRNTFNLKFELDGIKWEMDFSMQQSVHHVYMSRTLYKNGKKTTLASLNSAIKKATINYGKQK
ncbi:MAG: hypothetical protein ACYDAO_02710 [Thermoplasmataceae archaeon]